MQYEADLVSLDDYERAALKTMHDLPSPTRLLYLAGQLASEAGEILSPINKHLHHGKPLDRQALKLELGDELWYLTVLAHELGFSLREVAQANIVKLRARHGEQYNPQFYQGASNEY